MTDEKTLDILVVEDNPIHQASARFTLAGHNVTVVENFDEATEALEQKYAAVLTDLMLPATSTNQADRSTTGQQMPFGFPIALLAAQAGAPYIAIVTDMTHHSHPIAATFDYFIDNERSEAFKKETGNWPFYQDTCRPVFQVNKSALTLFDIRDLPAAFVSQTADMEKLQELTRDTTARWTKDEKSGLYCCATADSVCDPWKYTAKNWGAALEKIMSYQK